MVKRFYIFHVDLGSHYITVPVYGTKQEAKDYMIQCIGYIPGYFYVNTRDELDALTGGAIVNFA